MSMTDTQITLFSHALFRGASPTNDLLIKWEQTSPKISTLFSFLFSMDHLRAIMILRPFVSDQLRTLCDQKLSAHEVSNLTTTSGDKTSIHLPSTNNTQFNNNNDNNLFNSRSSQQGAVGGINTSVTGGLNSDSLVHNYVNYGKPEKKIVNNSMHWNDLSGRGDNEKVLNNQHPLDLQKPAKPPMLVVELNDKPLSTVKSSTETVLEGVDNMEVMYKELMLGTDDFSQDRVIGSGGFGVVYRGELKGTQVAIKRLKGIDNVAQAVNEFKVLNRYRIDNIVPLYGISLDGPEACIVYQYMPNGSLEDKLLGKGPGDRNVILSWNQRAHIGEGIAKGLNYLHTMKGKPLVHGDVKSANVLLDSQFEPKLGDFGLSRVIQSSTGMPGSGRGVYTHLTVTSVHGTSVYLPAEYLRQKILSPAVDAYSYGIVMMEMATGRRAFDGKKLLVDMVQDEIKEGERDPEREGAIKLKDPRLNINMQNLTASSSSSQAASTTGGSSLMTSNSIAPSSSVNACSVLHNSLDNQWFHSLITLGLDCANKNKKKRPSMSQVLDFYSQCKTRDRIRRISVESGASASLQGQNQQQNVAESIPPDVELKTPLELQLWYDMAKKDLHPGISLHPPSTVCPTIDSASVVDQEDILSASCNTSRAESCISAFTSRQTNLDSSLDMETPSMIGLPSAMHEISRQPCNTSAESAIDRFSETAQAVDANSSLESNVSSVIPLITELGITTTRVKETQD